MSIAASMLLLANSGGNGQKEINQATIASWIGQKKHWQSNGHAPVNVLISGASHCWSSQHLTVKHVIQQACFGACDCIHPVLWHIHIWCLQQTQKYCSMWGGQVTHACSCVRSINPGCTVQMCDACSKAKDVTQCQQICVKYACSGRWCLHRSCVYCVVLLLCGVSLL